jgi:hypothetical protein
VPLRILGVEIDASDDGAEDPAHAVAGLRQVDAGGRIALIPQHRGVGIGDRLQERKARSDHANARQERHKRGRR